MAKKEIYYWGNADDGADATKKEDKKMKICLIISPGPYETGAKKIDIMATTYTDFCSQVRQLKKKYAAFGDSWTGRIDAVVAVASCRDTWGEDLGPGGRLCRPAWGWIVDDHSISDHEMMGCTYKDAWAAAQEHV